MAEYFGVWANLTELLCEVSLLISTWYNDAWISLTSVFPWRIPKSCPSPCPRASFVFGGAPPCLGRTFAPGESWVCPGTPSGMFAETRNTSALRYVLFLCYFKHPIVPSDHWYAWLKGEVGIAQQRAPERIAGQEFSSPQKRMCNCKHTNSSFYIPGAVQRLAMKPVFPCAAGKYWAPAGACCPFPVPEKEDLEEHDSEAAPRVG